MAAQFSNQGFSDQRVSNRAAATRLDRAVAASVTAMVALNLAVFLQFQLPAQALAAAPIHAVELA